MNTDTNVRVAVQSFGNDIAG